MKITSQTLYLYIQIVLFCIPFAVGAFLFVQYFAVLGDVTVSYDFSKESEFVSEFTPAGRASSRLENLQNGDTYQAITGEPVYVQVSVPRSFDTVAATIEYENPEQPFIEFGLVTNEEPFQTRVYPMHSSVINEAAATWDALEQDGVILLQREAHYETVGEFLQNPPKTEGVATYRVPLDPHYSDELENGAPVVIDRYLRGPHRFFTYADDAGLDIRFTMQDINYGFDFDPIKIEVWKDSTLIHESLIEDDGVSEATGQPSQQYVEHIQLPEAGAGLYDVRVVVGDDIVIQRIESAQSYIVAKDSIFVVNNEEYAPVFPDLNTDPTQIYMNGSSLFAVTDHLTGIQQITIGGEALYVDKLHSPHWWDASNTHAYGDVLPVSIEKNDVHIHTKGYIAFSEESFFDPDYLIQELDVSTDIDDVNYILYKDYAVPTEGRSNQFTQTVNLSLDGVAGDRKELTFVLSAPGIDRLHHTIHIHDLSLTFSRPPIWQRFTQ